MLEDTYGSYDQLANDPKADIIKDEQKNVVLEQLQPVKVDASGEPILPTRGGEALQQRRAAEQRKIIEARGQQLGQELGNLTAEETKLLKEIDDALQADPNFRRLDPIEQSRRRQMAFADAKERLNLERRRGDVERRYQYMNEAEAY
jgi:hypothetical protein